LAEKFWIVSDSIFEPRLLARLGAPLAGPTILRLLRHAMENLAAYLERNGAVERRTGW
jgi:hypothetical protein